jgi:hypothetical protein
MFNARAALLYTERYVSMSKPAERDANLILLVSAGYPMATALMLFAAWVSFWTTGARVVPISPAYLGNEVVPEDQDEQLAQSSEAFYVTSSLESG